MNAKDQALLAWGELACFTRPELKAERFSYPVMTPSAARGIYDAIYCKPIEFRWQITAIEILAPPSYISLRRNEVKERVNEKAVQRWMKGKARPEPLWADDTESDAKGRTQRQTMALRNVRYRLHAQIRPWPGFEERLQGLEMQFRRRAAAGKCFYQPCFGCREFPAYFELVEPGVPGEVRLQLDMDLGLMLYDVFDLWRPGTATAEKSISLFHAGVRDGLLEVPDWADPRVLKGMSSE